MIKCHPSTTTKSMSFRGSDITTGGRVIMLIDVSTDDLAGLVAMGATVVREKGDGGLGWTVLQDPQGNEFCAFTRD